MSDNYLRVIPTEPTWQPAEEAAQRAVAALSALVPDADAVEAELFDEVTFITQGANFERLRSPACKAELAMDWWSEQMGRADEASFTSLAVTTLCCGADASLNDLTYEWPAGFASAELSVLNPQRSWLEAAELGFGIRRNGPPPQAGDCALLSRNVRLPQGGRPAVG